MLPFPETSIFLNTLWSEFRYLRQMRKMTLKEVSEITGLSVSFISDIEHGRSNPSLATLQKLVEAYKAPVALHINLQQLPSSAPWGEPLDYDIDYEAIKDELE